jgi:hypothetical protein
MSRARWIALVVVLLTLAFGAFVVSPWWSLAGFTQALKAGDKYRIELYVDFPRVKASLREQLNDKLAESVSSDLKDNPFAALGAMLGSAVVDRAVEAFVTPAGLARLMQHTVPEAAPTPEVPPESRVDIVRRLHDRVDLEWLSASSIRVKLLDDRGMVVTTAHLERQGLRWRIVDIEIPKMD